jgi:hypothetical protein
MKQSMRSLQAAQLSILIVFSAENRFHFSGKCFCPKKEKSGEDPKTFAALSETSDRGG